LTGRPQTSLDVDEARKGRLVILLALEIRPRWSGKLKTTARKGPMEKKKNWPKSGISEDLGRPKGGPGHEVAAAKNGRQRATTEIEPA